MKYIFILCITLLLVSPVEAEGTRSECAQQLRNMVFHFRLEKHCQNPSHESGVAREVYRTNGCNRVISKNEEEAILEQTLSAFSRKYGMRLDDGTTMDLNPQTCQVARDMLAYPWTWVLSDGARR
ncbi:hypothetical protein HMPREF2796_07765 [Eikenella sp. HMSC071B05]|nr:hypothetical protein HMPREF2796_07765 [Eikenella sp. HMSC071B05]OFO44965.1 hypothetical protein HMPREF3043_07440 [Eikenella sp. HMSC073A11]